MTDTSDDNSPKKKKQTRNRNCVFNSKWLHDSKFKNWVQAGVNSTSAQCKTCNVTLNVQYDGVKALKMHMESKKHKTYETAAKQSNIVSKYFTKRNETEEDAVTITELCKIYHGVKHHHSFLSMDCESKMSSQLYPDSDICSKIRLGRTKIECIVQNVMAPYSIEYLVKKIKTDEKHLPYSIGTDASNKGNKKLFPISIKFFDVEGQGQTDGLLNFVEQPDETSQAIYGLIVDTIKERELKCSRMVSFSGDNANVNFGKKSSVFTKLRDQMPKLVKSGCNCHIIHNTARNAIKTISYDVETIVLKVFKEFSISAKKNEHLKECFAFCDLEYQNILRHVTTRWLSLFKALDRLIQSWPAIKTYFLEQGEDECDRSIWKFIKDQANGLSVTLTLPECYLYFIHSFLFLFQKNILRLEKNKTDVTELYYIMSNIRDELTSRKNDEFYGFNVIQNLKFLPESEIKKFKADANTVFERALNYLEQWFDFKTDIYQIFSKFNFKNDFNLQISDVIKANEIFGLEINNFGDEIYTELRLLKIIIENDAFKMETKTLENSDIWLKIFQKNKFEHLQNLMEHILCIPCSNSYVERCFSIMSNIWRDDRNRLLPENVAAEIFITENLNVPCNQFKNLISANKKLLKDARSNKKYTFGIQN